VLSGQRATLSFEEEISDEEGGEENRKKKWKPIRILPSSKDAAATDNKFSNYVVPSSFRLIATMNDKDAARLAKLSYALQRRFCTIRMAPLSASKLVKIAIKHLRNKITWYGENHGLSLPGNMEGGQFSVWGGISSFRGTTVQDEANNNINISSEIMAKSGVLSPSVVKTTIDLMLSMLASENGDNINGLGGGIGANLRRTQLIRSCLLAALNMTLLPQLRSLLGAGTQRQPEQLAQILKGLRQFFSNGHDNYQDFLVFDAHTGTWAGDRGSMLDVLNAELDLLFQDTMFDPTPPQDA